MSWTQEFCLLAERGASPTTRGPASHRPEATQRAGWAWGAGAVPRAGTGGGAGWGGVGWGGVGVAAGQRLRGAQVGLGLRRQPAPRGSVPSLAGRQPAGQEGR